MKRLSILLFAFFALMMNANAQETEKTEKYLSIAGRIVDLESKDPLGGVKIVNESRNNIVASKKSGFYSIVASPGDIIRFTHVGYMPEYMKINETTSTKATVMIHLTPDDNYLEEIVVGDLPSEDELNDYFMSLEVEEDANRAIAEANPETFTILDNIETPPPGGPVSFLKKHVFDKMKQKKKKPGRTKKLPKYKN